MASALPALLVTILIFMDQQITAVIVNRKEHKLKVCFFFCLLVHYCELVHKERWGAVQPHFYHVGQGFRPEAMELTRCIKPRSAETESNWVNFNLG